MTKQESTRARIEAITESWIMIDVKDPLWLKQAKIADRERATIAIEKLLDQEANKRVEAALQDLRSQVTQFKDGSEARSLSVKKLDAAIEKYKPKEVEEHE